VRRILLAAFAVILAPAVAGQIPIGAPSLAVNVNGQDFGEPGSALDDCWVLDMDATATPGATSFDLRLVPCQGRQAGTEVGDNDTTERSAAYPQANGGAAEGVRYADVNSNGRYDGGDYVYVTSSPGAGVGLVATTASGSWTIRLTPTGAEHGGFPAGTLVRQEDADCTAYCPNAADFGPASIGWFDADGSTGYTPGDTAYLMPRAPGAPAGSLVPPSSLRLTASSPPEASSSTSSTPDDPSTSTAPSTSPGATPSSADGRSSGTEPLDDAPSIPGPPIALLLLALTCSVLVRRR
jgi:hypothetical protein